jgi:uncharacterized membrane protein
MMLLLAIALIAGALVAWFMIPELQIYLTYPWPAYVIMLLAIAAAVRSHARGWIKFPVLTLVVALSGLFAFYTMSMSRLEATSLTVSPGDALPSFRLPTSQGGSFSTDELKGYSPALFVFYRGDW